MSMIQNCTSRLEMIQALRAFAAIAVVFGHAQTDALSLAATKMGGFVPFLIEWTGAGVDLFFVISGFVMVYASQRLFAVKGGAATFLYRRLARIVPLYWGVTTLFLLVMLVSPVLLSSGAPAVQEIVKSYLFIPYAKDGAEMMQPVYKLGWTLNYEMAFYLIFALLIGLPRRIAVLMLAAFLITLVGIGLVFAPPRTMVAFWTSPIILEFGIGALLASFRLDGLRIARWAAISLILLAMAWLALAPIPQWGSEWEPYRPLLWGVPAALMVAAVTLHDVPMTGKAASFTALLGDASYSIYLLHPLVIRVIRILWEKIGFASMISPWIFVGVIIIATVVVSLAAYRWFEKPFTAWLQKKGGGRPEHSRRKGVDPANLYIRGC